MATVTLRHINKSFSAQTPILQDINLHVAEGELMVLVGPSGCGKSTLLRLIAGLEQTDAGDIEINSEKVNTLPPRARNIAVVFQDYALYPHKSVFDNMAFGLKMQNKSRAYIEQRVSEVADTLQITPLLQRKPRDLSGGQRQRVAIGRAMVRDPRVFLFDEPLSNLDARLRNDMRSEIKRIHQRFQHTMIYVTHDQVEAMTLANRIAVMNGGKIVQIGTPDEIYAKPNSRFVAEFIGTPVMNFLSVIPFPANQPRQLQLGTLELPLPECCQLTTNSASYRQLHMGLRAEHIRLGSFSQQADDVITEASVILIEPLGAEFQLRLLLQGHEIITRVSALLPAPHIGETVKIILSLHYVYLFDPQTGAAVNAPPSAQALRFDDELVAI